MTPPGLPPVDDDHSAALKDALERARATNTPLAISGGGSKTFYGRSINAELFDVSAHRGVVGYEPTELVITARGGTSLAGLQQTLADHGQMLPFEPPHFGPAATLGGAIACGLSGPRRPYAGAARDFVLGTKVLTGKGEILSFGGQVMKNVAGYDVSRLMAGSLGTLGVILEVSLKVLPKPAVERTVVLEMNAATAIKTMNAWAGKPLPLSAACHDGTALMCRLSGTESGVAAAAKKLAGETLTDPTFWESVREHTHPFFDGTEPLWRLSVPPAAMSLDLPGQWLLDWGGAQRWLRTEADAAAVRDAATAAGGHAVLFRHGDRTGEVFHPLAPGIEQFHRRLKNSFDPDGILNPGRMYPGI